MLFSMIVAIGPWNSIATHINLLHKKRKKKEEEKKRHLIEKPAGQFHTVDFFFGEFMKPF